MTIRSKVIAQKLRRRMWSVRGIGTMQKHFTVEDCGCPREKQGFGARVPGPEFRVPANYSLNTITSLDPLKRISWITRVPSALKL